MDILTSICQNYVIDNFNEISNMNVETRIENPEKVEYFANHFSLDVLINKNHSNKLVKELFRVKLLMNVDSKKLYLHKCIYCNKLFNMRHVNLLPCDRPRRPDDDDETLTHEPDLRWDFKHFLIYCKKIYQLSWRELYWKVWSYSVVFKCKYCRSHYQIS